MARSAALEETDTKPARLMPALLIGVALAVAAGGGGYWAVTTGPFAPDRAATDDTAGVEATEPARPVEVAFVGLETVVIALGPDLDGRNLIFTAELEVTPGYENEVERLTPRILDVLNSYLRVVSLAELEDPTSLARIRAQLLRRIQVVTGPGRVRDLLVTQFVVN